MVKSKYHILVEKANGVQDEQGRFYPFTSGTGTDCAQSAQENIRYYIKSVLIVHGQAGVHAETSAYIGCTVGGRDIRIGYVYVPETFVASNDCISSQISCGILTDVNTAITQTGGLGSIIFAIIHETSGEYL